MLLSPYRLALFASFLSYAYAASIPQSLQHRQASSSDEDVVIVYIETEVIEYVVLLDFYFEWTTTFMVGDSVTIIISEAPTSISTLITATITGTISPALNTTISSADTQALTPTSAGTSATEISTTASIGATSTAPATFSLGVLQDSNAKRQADTQYVNRQGQVGSESTAAAVFQLNSGQLSIGGNVISTEFGISYRQFLSFDGNISTTFSADDSGVFQWQNETFQDGQARFCSDENNVIISVFDGSLPAGCSPVTLILMTAVSLTPSQDTSTILSSTPSISSTDLVPLVTPAPNTSTSALSTMQDSSSDRGRSLISAHGNYTRTHVAPGGKHEKLSSLSSDSVIVYPTTTRRRCSKVSTINPHSQKTDSIPSTTEAAGEVFSGISLTFTVSETLAGLDTSEYTTIKRYSTLTIFETSTVWKHSASFGTISVSSTSVESSISPNLPSSTSTVVVSAVLTSSLTSSASMTDSNSNSVTETAEPTSTPFALAMNAQSGTKRDTSLSYVDAEGYLNSDSSEAIIFYIINGRLLANGYWVSTAPGLDYNPLLNSSGSISTTFSLSNGNLEWQNSGFPNSVASYCVDNNSKVFAFFSSNVPDGCDVGDILVVPAVDVASTAVAAATSTRCSLSTSSSLPESSSPTPTTEAAMTTSSSSSASPGIFLQSSFLTSASSTPTSGASISPAVPSSSSSVSVVSSTVTSACATPPAGFIILVSEAGITATQYLYDDDDLSDDTLTITKNMTLAQTFSFTSTNQLQMAVPNQSGQTVILVSEQDPENAGAEPVFFSPASEISPAGSYLPVYAELAADCTSLSMVQPYNGASVLQECGGVLHLLTAAGVNGDCTTVSLTIDSV